MLLPREQSPWNCGYYLGAIALRALRDSAGGKLDLPNLQRHMSLLAARAISSTQVVMAASWLFLLGAVQLDADGAIALCD